VRPGRAGQGPFGRPAGQVPELNDEPDARRIEQQRGLGQHVPVDDQQVGELSCLHGADVLFQADCFSGDGRRGPQRVSRAEAVVNHADKLKGSGLPAQALRV